MGERTLRLQVRTQILSQDSRGYAIWQVVNEPRTLPVSQTMLLLCDVWDSHWSRGAVERLDAMVPRMNEVACWARDRGIQVIHAPSDTMDYYAGTSARQRMIDARYVALPSSLEHPDPPLPIDDSDGGSDTGETPWHKAWSRQHAAIEIDQDRDGISDSGQEVYNLACERGLSNLILMGVHTNVCVLRRSFAVKQMVRWGLNVFLLRDLTDTMYNPAMPPYVPHEEGTRLVVSYIEKFWCPTIHSADLLSSAG